MSSTTEQINKIYGEKLRIRVCGILIHENKLLLVHHKSLGQIGSLWAPPGGGMEYGEDARGALKREFLEETSFSLDFLYLGDFKLMMNRTNIKEHIFFGLNPKKIDQSNPEKGLEVSFVNRQELINRSITGGYKQLAGLGIIQLVSNYLRLDIMNSSMEDISKKFREKKNNEK